MAVRGCGIFGYDVGIYTNCFIMSSGRPPKILAASPAILRFFEQSPRRVYSRQELVKILSQRRVAWQLAASTSRDQFMELIMTGEAAGSTNHAG